MTKKVARLHQKKTNIHIKAEGHIYLKPICVYLILNKVRVHQTKRETSVRTFFLVPANQQRRTLLTSLIFPAERLCLTVRFSIKLPGLLGTPTKHNRSFLQPQVIDISANGPIFHYQFIHFCITNIREFPFHPFDPRSRIDFLSFFSSRFH